MDGFSASSSRFASSEYGHAGERTGLVQVRRHDGRERKEPLDQRLDGVVLEELRARGSDHHGIDDERHGMAGQEVGDGLDDRSAEEHPRLRRVDADVVEHDLELRRG